MPGRSQKQNSNITSVLFLIFKAISYIKNETVKYLLARDVHVFKQAMFCLLVPMLRIMYHDFVVCLGTSLNQ
jgi:hypothetical protein